MCPLCVHACTYNHLVRNDIDSVANVVPDRLLFGVCRVLITEQQLDPFRLLTIVRSLLASSTSPHFLCSDLCWFNYCGCAPVTATIIKASGKGRCYFCRRRWWSPYSRGLIFCRQVKGQHQHRPPCLHHL